MEVKEIISLVLSAMLGTLGFSIFFRSNKSRVFACVIGGMLVTLAYVGCVSISDNLFFQNFVPGLVATAYAEIMARVMKAPATPILVCSAISLVPGGRLYYTTYYLVINDAVNFNKELTEMLQVAAGITLGITFISVIVYEINRNKSKQIFEMK